MDRCDIRRGLRFVEPVVQCASEVCVALVAVAAAHPPLVLKHVVKSRERAWRMEAERMV